MLVTKEGTQLKGYSLCLINRRKQTFEVRRQGKKNKGHNLVQSSTNNMENG